MRPVQRTQRKQQACTAKTHFACDLDWTATAWGSVFAEQLPMNIYQRTFGCIRTAVWLANRQNRTEPVQKTEFFV